ncbi:MAG: hypothetical protein ABI557_07720 [Aureliella sp.]
MAQSQDTRESLLIALRDPGNTTAWKEFSAIYRPMISHIARRMGLHPSDAEDAAQQLMLTVSQAIGGWSKEEANIDGVCFVLLRSGGDQNLQPRAG